MTIKECLSRVRVVRLEAVGESADQLLPVFRTVAEEFSRIGDARVEVGSAVDAPEDGPEPGVLRILTAPVGDSAVPVQPPGLPGLGLDQAVFFSLQEDGGGLLATSSPHLLFPFFIHLLRDLGDRALGGLEEGEVFPTAFSWIRSTFDFFLTQEGRIQKGLDREAYVRRLA